MEKLSTKSEFVLKQLYKIYLDKLEDGDTHFQATHFGSCKNIQDKYFIGFTFDELHKCINYLACKDYLLVSDASNIPVYIILKDSAILHFEKEYSKNINNLLKDLNKLKKLLGI